MNTLKCHLLDEKIIYQLNDQKINELPVSFHIGRPKTEEDLITTFQSLIKKYKLNKKIIGDSLLLVLNDTYTDYDTSNLKHHLQELGFNQINITKESEKIPPNDIYCLIDNTTTRIFTNSQSKIIDTFIYIQKSKVIIKILKQLYPNKTINIINYTNSTNNIPPNSQDIYIYSHSIEFTKSLFQ